MASKEYCSGYNAGKRFAERQIKAQTEFTLRQEIRILTRMNESKAAEIRRLEAKVKSQSPITEGGINLISDVVDGLKRIDETECSKDTWDMVQCVIADLKSFI